MSALQINSAGDRGSLSAHGMGCSTEIEKEAADGSPRPMRRDRGHTISDMNPSQRRIQLRNVLNKRQPPSAPTSSANTTSSSSGSSGSNKKDSGKGGISPSSVFLQLYYHGGFDSLGSRPIHLPTNVPEIQRSIRLLDMIPSQENHKIGVLYVGRDQTTEQEILSNTHGSLRYAIFIQGLGRCIELNETAGKEYFLGGLETRGIDGKNVYIWQDDVMQVVYHIATMMPNRENDPKCASKKRHIGNNYVTIVYNESGRPYKIDTLSGQFNHSVVEIRPGDHNTNSVGVINKQDMLDFIGENAAPRLVSDFNLAILVRQLALHANLASMVWESLKNPNPYATNWLERLRKIKKIKDKLPQKDDADIEGHDKVDFSDIIEFEQNRSRGSNIKK